MSHAHIHPKSGARKRMASVCEGNRICCRVSEMITRRMASELWLHAKNAYRRELEREGK